MYKIGIYSWSQLGTPAALTPDHLAGDDHANAPGTPTYNGAEPSWTGQSYTYSGTAATPVLINDDDALFEDASQETGAQATLAEAVTIDGVEYAAGSVIESAFSLVDGSGAEVWVVRIDGVNVGFAPTAAYPSIPAGSVFQPVQARDGDAANSTDGQSSTEAYSGVVCFVEHVRIATPRGAVPAGALAEGDTVLTADRGASPLLWTGRRSLALDAPDHPARPVLIAPGALGAGLPLRPLALSPQHRVLLSGPVVQARCGTGEVLVPARALLGLPGIRVMRGLRRVSYVHLLLAHHEILRAEGAGCESLYAGPTALRMLGPAAAAELRLRLGGGDPGAPGRPFLSRREGAALARRLLAAPPRAVPA